MNSVANGKIKKNSNFKKIFIQPASGDAGGALGAALEVYSRFKKIKQRGSFNSYLGPSYSNHEISRIFAHLIFFYVSIPYSSSTGSLL